MAAVTSAVTVSLLHRGALLFKRVQRSRQPGVAGMPIRRCTGTHLSVPERTMVHPGDAPIPRFVMMGSGVRIPLAAPLEIVSGPDTQVTVLGVHPNSYR